MTIYSIDFTNPLDATTKYPGARGSIGLVSKAAGEAITAADGAELSVQLSEVNANGERSRLSTTADHETLEAIIKVTINRLRKEAREANEQTAGGQEEKVNDSSETEAQLAQDDRAQYGENPVTGY